MLHSTLTDVQIRPERADHPEVIALLVALDSSLAALYPPEANHLLSVAELLAPEVALFAAWQGDRVVGTGATRRMPGNARSGGRLYGEVKRMFVDPAVRGQGIAVRLVQTLEAGLRAQQIRLATLETGRDQPEAVHLFQRSGYRQRGAFGGYPDNGLSLFFEKYL